MTVREKSACETLRAILASLRALEYLAMLSMTHGFGSQHIIPRAVINVDTVVKYQSDGVNPTYYPKSCHPC